MSHSVNHSGVVGIGYVTVSQNANKICSEKLSLNII
jgi:hypothetical protein